MQGCLQVCATVSAGTSSSLALHRAKLAGCKRFANSVEDAFFRQVFNNPDR